MNWSFYALVLGFCIDLLLGDPHGFPHPVVLIGKLIDALGRLFRALLPKTKSGEIAAGALLWVFTAAVSTAIPALLLMFAQKISVWLRLALESIMCWQILATKSLRDESMKVYAALQNPDWVSGARALVSEQREYLTRALQSLKLTVCPSRANYLLFCAPVGLDEALRREKIAIRNCGNYPGLCPGWYRIAVRQKEENEALINAIRRAMEEPSWH